MNLQRRGYDDGALTLDLFSTSQTFDAVLSENVKICASEKCINNAPFFAYKKRERTYGVVQGCCNSWNCPRCGQQRAKTEYGRIVEGCRTLSEEHELWFITITCRGREMSKKDADDGYGKWTNTLLTRWRTYCTRKGKSWYYAQVTERQTRGHPHSHILTTFSPPDMVMGKKPKYKTDNEGRKKLEMVPAILSDFIRRSSVDAGLGDQYDISRVESVEGASRYVAKYLFKDEIFSTVWPKGWKRVRYSQGFPKLAKRDTDAFVLMSREHWQKLAGLADVIITKEDEVKERVFNAIGYNGIIIK